MKLIKCYQTTSDWYKGAKRGSTPVGILWHDTAGGNPYLKRYVQPSDDAADKAEMLELLGKNKYNNDWNHSSRSAGLNAWIGLLADGSMATIQAGDWDIHPWGCGGGDKGSCNGYEKYSNGSSAWVNRHWIQFEICDDGYGDESYFKTAYQEAIEFTAYICKEFGIDPNGTVEFNGVTVPTILCHADSYKLKLGGNHGDIYSWFNKYGYDMNNVRADVAKLLGHESVVADKTEFHILDEVKIKDGVTTFSNGVTMQSWVPSAKLYVRKITDNKITVSTKTEGAVTGTVFDTDLELVNCPHATNEPEPDYTVIQHTVVKGETFYGIGKKYGVNYKDIMTWNNITDATTLNVGTVLEIRLPKETEVIEEEAKPALNLEAGYVSTGSDEDQLRMWNYFKDEIFEGNEFAAAGMIGNIYAECGLRSNNLQNSYEKKLSLSDEAYTAAVDCGEYTNFVKDSAGYGLVQWTYWSRKETMFNIHKEANKSIGDFETQLSVIKYEFEHQFKKLRNQLIAATSVKEASDLILINFEAPASCNEEATQVKRAGYSQKYYDKFATPVEENPIEVVPEEPEVEAPIEEPEIESPVAPVEDEKPAEVISDDVVEEPDSDGDVINVNALKALLDWIICIFKKIFKR